MLFSRVVIAATALFASAQALDLNLPVDNLGLGNVLGGGVDLGLLTSGSLINLDAVLNALSPDTCTTGGGGTVGVATVLPSISIAGSPAYTLAKICLCINALNLQNILQIGQLISDEACPPCPANANAICASGTCACACADGFYSDSVTGQCVATSSCVSPKVLVSNADGTSTCKCPDGQVDSANGGCSLAPTARARARSMHRKTKKSVSHPHAARAGQEVLSAPALKPIDPKAETCPDGETACRLSTGGFECIDTTNALNSCGGCVGTGLEGQNCLSIPGALNVQCENSACKVSSCFKGWSLKGGKCV